MDGEDPISLAAIGRLLGVGRDRILNLDRIGLADLSRVSDQFDAFGAC